MSKSKSKSHELSDGEMAAIKCYALQLRAADHKKSLKEAFAEALRGYLETDWDQLWTSEPADKGRKFFSFDLKNGGQVSSEVRWREPLSPDLAKLAKTVSYPATYLSPEDHATLLARAR